MKFLILFLALLALAAPPANAEPGARAVIERQLDAFEARDLESAYGFAAPVIQQKFRSPEIFGEMVERGYPMIWAPSTYEFLESETFDGGVIERMRVYDDAGRPFIAEYRMVRVSGEWRIAAVRVLADEKSGRLTTAEAPRSLQDTDTEHALSAHHTKPIWLL